MSEATLPPRIADRARRIDKELLVTLAEMIRDREAITAAAAVRRMPSVTQVSTLTRDAWRAAQLAEFKAEQIRGQQPIEQLSLGTDNNFRKQYFLGFTYFLSVAQAGNLGRSARQLNVDQATLSHHIRNLESGLGAQLFVRHSRGVTLTQAGVALVTDLHAVSDAPHQSLGLNSASGRPTIAIPLELGLHVVPPFIEALQRENPGDVVAIREGNSAFLEELIVSNQAHVAILQDSPKFDSLKGEPVLVEEVGLVTSSSLRRHTIAQHVSLAEVTGRRLILPSQKYSLRRKLDDAAFRYGMQLRVILEVDSIPLIKSLVQKGMGSTVLPLMAVREELSRGTFDFQAIDHPLITATYSIVEGRPENAYLAKRFASVLRNIITSQVESGYWPGARLIKPPVSGVG
jgi:LysR family nitrogen assimilation transcriptional regulator